VSVSGKSRSESTSTRTNADVMCDTALVSPSDFHKAIPLLATHTRPKVELMTFPTGLSVLHTPFYHPKIFSNRLASQLTPTGSDEVEKAMSTVEIALTEGLSVGLAKELVYLVESQFGQVVRDEQAQEQGGGERWYRNLINDTQMCDI
jgi:ESCRT-II complex subunit VPS36